MGPLEGVGKIGPDRAAEGWIPLLVVVEIPVYISKIGEFRRDLHDRGRLEFATGGRGGAERRCTTQLRKFALVE